MLKISLLALAVFAACQVDGGKLPSNRRFQRQEAYPYPPSGFLPEGNSFELPTENQLPETSAEQLDNNNSELESFNQLKSPVKSEKLVQGQLQTNVASVPVNYVQQTSPVFAKIQAVQPQLAFNTPFNYAAYQQAFLQPSVVAGQLQNVQQSTLVNGKLQQTATLGSVQPTVFGSQVQQPAIQLQHPSNGQLQPTATLGSVQPTVFSQLQQPALFNAQLQQPSIYSSYFQQPTIYSAPLQQLQQNYW